MNKSELYKLMYELKDWGNTNAALQYLVKKICLNNDWTYGEIWLPDNDNNFLKWAGFWSLKKDYLENFARFSSLHKFAKGVGLIGLSREQKKLLWIEDILSDNSFLRAEIAVNNQINSAISIPIFYKDEIKAVLCFFMKSISENDKETAELISNASNEIGDVVFNLV